MIKFFDEEKNIWAQDDLYLDRILNREEYRNIYPLMFDRKNKVISVLNKGICGNGGTTGMIRYALAEDKGLLVLVPNVSIVLSKESEFKENKNFCFVYGGSGKLDVDAQIVIATYDQYPRMMKNLKSAAVKTDGLEMKFWSGRTVIIDEYHKLITENGFRQVCIGITDLIRNVDEPVVLMSATPCIEYVGMLRELLPEREIVNYNVIYPYEVRNHITVYDVKEDRFIPVFFNMMKGNRHICIFYNCVRDVESLALQLGNECEILCSSSKKDKLRDMYSESFNPDKKVHFLTSAFFTGCDLPDYVDKVVIVGSNEFDFMALSQMDIKQILGRFRIKGGGVRYYDNYIFYVNKKVDPGNYTRNKTDYDLKDMALKSGDYDWKNVEGGIEVKQNHIRLKMVLDTYDMWSSCDSLMYALGEYGFDVDKGDTTEINDLKIIKKKKQLGFKKVKTMVKEGKPVSSFMYKDINEILEYKDVFGVDKMMRASKSHISNWYKVWSLVKGVELEGLKKEDLCDIFELDDHRIYPARYLMECLDYFCECSYDKLQEKMMDVFGVTVVDLRFWNTKMYDNQYVIIKSNPMVDFFQKVTQKRGSSLKKNVIFESTFRKNLPSVKLPEINFSYEVRSNTSGSYSKSKRMEDILKDGGMRSLASNPDWKWMMEDKRSRLPVIKSDSDRLKRIKIFGQSKLSEMYVNGSNQFKFNKDNDYYADCLVCDIDGGMRLSEFKEIYGQWMWYAIPTFSNVEDDFTKFRVIIPLASTIHLGSGENNLRVLKCLRKMFCHYEDPCHQMYFQCNLQDYMNTVINDGEVFEVSQDIVDNLHQYIDNCIEFKKKHLDRNRVEKVIDGVKVEFKYERTWTLDQAKEYYSKYDRDGMRHDAIWVIKNNIMPEYFDQAKEWIYSIGKKSHWDNNSVKD